MVGAPRRSPTSEQRMGPCACEVPSQGEVKCSASGKIRRQIRIKYVSSAGARCPICTIHTARLLRICSRNQLSPKPRKECEQRLTSYEQTEANKDALPSRSPANAWECQVERAILALLCMFKGHRESWAEAQEGG